MIEHNAKMTFMGQWLHNPPSVEGWHQGEEWIETGSLVERVNFASEQLGDRSMPGVASMVSKLVDEGVSADELLERCLEELGELDLTEDTSENLREYVTAGGPVDDEKITGMLRLIAASRDFQRC